MSIHNRVYFWNLKASILIIGFIHKSLRITSFYCKKLGIKSSDTGLVSKIKLFIARHTFLLLVNYHSEHSGIYNLWLEKSSDERGVTLKTTHKKSFPQLNVLIASGIKTIYDID
jgi:hypothetical protein